MDMIRRLRDISRASFDSIYEDVFGHSGGWAVGCCPHGVSYAIKNNFRGESPRDYVDLLRGMKHQPTISICDVAHLVANFANSRFDQMFGPNDGRLAEANEDNIRRAKSHELTFKAEFLDDINKPYEICDDPVHPVKKSNHHYALYDWFHQENCKSETEILRRISLVDNIAGFIDSERDEQEFSQRKKDIYFLNKMKPGTHMFVFRLITHLRNESINLMLNKKMKDHLGSIQQDPIGRTIQAPKGSMQKHADCNKKVEKSTISITRRLPEQNISSNQSRVDEVSLRSRCLSFINKLTNPKILNAFIDLNISEMCGEELRGVHDNLLYASTVIGKTAPSHRHIEVRANCDGVMYMQTQGSTNYCGLCAVNNLVGASAISIKYMDSISDALWIGQLLNPGIGPTCRILPPRDLEGFYSMDVIEDCLERLHCEVINIVAGVGSSESDEELLLLLESAFGGSAGTCIMSLLIKTARSDHWVVVRRGASKRFYLLDSRQARPVELSNSYCLDYLRIQSISGAVYAVRSRQTHVLLQDDQSPPDLTPNLVGENNEENVVTDMTSSELRSNLVGENNEENVVTDMTSFELRSNLGIENNEENVVTDMTSSEVRSNLVGENNEENVVTDMTSRKRSFLEQAVSEIDLEVHQQLRINPKKARQSVSFVWEFPRPQKRRRSAFLSDLPADIQIYCLCEKTDTGSLYIACDECKCWFHPPCVGMKELSELEAEAIEFVCDTCQNKEMKNTGTVRNVALKRKSRKPKESRLKSISELPQDMKVFCFCKNKSVNVIVCNSQFCQWAIHPECIGVKSEHLDLNDMYFCVMCSIGQLRKKCLDALKKVFFNTKN
ncbi:uncharacterized protein LOC141913049 [Tubulanus polymorphus]|uniref:uncharacterized protein LOC141913049 n=1 Tax=Tubulanus polymorphus TaxID=672921 RepID=UPI003DA6CA04